MNKVMLPRQGAGNVAVTPFALFAIAYSFRHSERAVALTSLVVAALFTLLAAVALLPLLVPVAEVKDGFLILRRVGLVKYRIAVADITRVETPAILHRVFEVVVITVSGKRYVYPLSVPDQTAVEIVTLVASMVKQPNPALQPTVAPSAQLPSAALPLRRG
jgi:hypothetical protein